MTAGSCRHLPEPPTPPRSRVPPARSPQRRARLGTGGDGPGARGIACSCSSPSASAPHRAPGSRSLALPLPSTAVLSCVCFSTAQRQHTTLQLYTEFSRTGYHVLRAPPGQHIRVRLPASASHPLQRSLQPSRSITLTREKASLHPSEQHAVITRQALLSPPSQPCGATSFFSEKSWTHSL